MLDDSGMRALMASACLKACVDYKKASLGKHIEGKKKHPDLIMYECTEFFKTEIFQYFVGGMDIEEIERRLQKSKMSDIRKASAFLEKK